LLSSLLQYSFWDPPTKIGANVDLVVPPHQFSHLVESYGLKVTLTNDNLQKTIDEESPKRQRKLAAGELDWENYHTLTEIYDWLNALQTEFSEFLSVEEIGRTYEGRSLKLVKLSKKTVIEISF
jgi:hypothetical protein